MKMRYMVWGWLALMMASCSQEEQVEQEITPLKGDVKVTATLDGKAGDTRIGYTETTDMTYMTWEQGDPIDLYTTEGNTVVYKAVADGGTEFSPNGNDRLVNTEGEVVYAVYSPETLGSSVITEDTKTIKLPNMQGWWGPNDIQPILYAVGTISNGSLALQFEHIQTYLKVTINTNVIPASLNTTVGRLAIVTEDSSPLCFVGGDTDVYDITTQTFNVEPITYLNVGMQDVDFTTNSEVTFRVPIMPQTSGSLRFEVYTADNDSLVYTLSKEVPSAGLQAGHLYPVTLSRDASSGGEVAYLAAGSVFNERVKQLANNSTTMTVNDTDQAIKSITFQVGVTEVPANYVTVSADDSPAPIYASFSEEDGLLTVSTPAKSIEIADASYLCRQMSALQSVDWGGFVINETTITLEGMFHGCTALTSLDVSGWNTSQVKNMGSIFYECSALTSLDVSGWDTSNGRSMGNLFNSCSALTTLDVSGWDTANATSMNGMFFNCTNLSALDVSGWNTSNVTRMGSMFAGCSSLTSLNVSGWNTVNVTDMETMFHFCGALTSLDLSAWNVSAVTNMTAMFQGCSALSSLNMANWGTSNVTGMSFMFSSCKALETLDLSTWDVSKVTDMTSMFQNCEALTSLNVANWNTGSVTQTINMFNGCTALETLDLSGWDTSNMELMYHMFEGCSALKSLDVSTWNLAKATDISYMFASCAQLETLDVAKWNTPSLTNPAFMFRGCSALKTLDLSNWDMAKAGNLIGMFEGCTALESLEISGWDTSNVTDINSLFAGCAALKTFDVSKWNTANVTNMYGVFSSCTALTSLDLSAWNTSNVTDMSSMFNACEAMTDLNLSTWDVSNVTTMRDMFQTCWALSSLDITKWVLNENTDYSGMFTACAQNSQACTITCTTDTQSRLQGMLETTSMNEPYFLWNIVDATGTTTY